MLDPDLPDMSRLLLLEATRMQRESVPIVLLSNRDDGVSKVPAFELGVDDYVTKPFGMGERLARISAGLRHQLQAQGERPVFRVNDLLSILCGVS